MIDTRRLEGEELRQHLLVLRCQAGDEQAFASLLRMFGGRTLGYLRELVGEDAEDVQQEVWMTVYRRISALDDARAFPGWLFRTTRHRAIDFLRKRRREAELLERSALEMAVDGATYTETEQSDVDVAGLSAVMAELPKAQREVLLLRYQEEMSYAEISLVVGCSVGTVKSRLFHARRRLQELVERE